MWQNVFLTNVTHWCFRRVLTSQQRIGDGEWVKHFLCLCFTMYIFFLLSFVFYEKIGEGEGGTSCQKMVSSDQIRLSVCATTNIDNYVCADLNEVSIRKVYMPFLFYQDNHMQLYILSKTTNL